MNTTQNSDTFSFRKVKLKIYLSVFIFDYFFSFFFFLQLLDSLLLNRYIKTVFMRYKLNSHQ